MSVAVKIQDKIIDKNYCDTQGLLKDNPVYKPFRYPWCYDAWLTQQRIHWLPEAYRRRNTTRNPFGPAHTTPTGPG